MNNPFKVEGPALVSFSGGRTSAFMLRNILQAHGGKLPDDVVVAFANTGKERPETLQFVHECGARWGVPIVWLEWRIQPRQVLGRKTLGPWLETHDPARTMVDELGFRRVDFVTVSRNGEPFAALIAMKQTTPNAVRRFCTEELKVTVIERYLRNLGWTAWTNVVGLRRDETKRVHRRMAAEGAEDYGRPYKSAFPLFDAGQSRNNVDEFWAEQPFDLGLPSSDSNCDGCFLKSEKRLMWLERMQPGSLAWWAAQEITGKGRFVTEYSMQSLIDRVGREPLLPGLMDDDEHDVECGLICAPIGKENAA